jgi:hypothetical protein
MVFKENIYMESISKHTELFKQENFFYRRGIGNAGEKESSVQQPFSFNCFFIDNLWCISWTGFKSNV